MITFLGVFGALLIVLGLLLIALDFAAMANHPTPSQYSMGVAQWGGILCVLGLVFEVGALCAAFLP